MTQAHDPQFPQKSSGSWYPTNYVVGVIDNLQEAQRAQQAFKEAGYNAEEIRLMESKEATQKVQELEEDKNPLQRILANFQSATNEDWEIVYQLEAEKGGHILYVHADKEEQVDMISALMQRHHAHTIKFFGTWSVADVLPRPPQ